MKQLIWFGVVLAIALSVMPAASVQATVPLPHYVLSTSNVGWMCIQPEYEAPINGLTIVLQPCDYQNNYQNYYQRWRFTYVRHNSSGAHLWQLVNLGSGMCLDLRDGATADGSPVQQWTCNTTSTTMLWTREVPKGLTFWQYRNERSGKCLDVRGGSQAPGTVLQIYRCTSTATSPNPAQLFQRDDLYFY